LAYIKFRRDPAKLLENAPISICAYSVAKPVSTPDQVEGMLLRNTHCLPGIFA